MSAEMYMLAIVAMSIIGLSYQTQVMWNKVIDLQMKQIKYDTKLEKKHLAFQETLAKELKSIHLKALNL